MKLNDLLLCTFQGDSATPPTNYVGEITAIDTGATTLDCRLVDSGQQFTFNYGSEPWTGTDSAGASYTLASHNVYTGGRIDPYAGGVAQVTFADNNRYLCYVNSVDPSIDIIFYHYPCPEVSIENFVITKSSWDAYPVGSQVASIEGCNLSNELPEDDDIPASGAGAASADGPYLIVDVSPWEVRPDWNVLVNTANFHGGILKATQGLKGHYNDRGWFKRNWPVVKSIAGARYGVDWFRGAYLFLNLWQDGSDQADHYLDAITDAGGWDAGDIIPIIDVELGNDGSDGRPRNRNNDVSAQQIIDCTTACADRLKSVTGRNIMLYGRGAMRDKGINSKMGCDIVWNPCYTSTIVMHGLEAWTLEDVALWQYCGDGYAKLDPAKYPKSIPNFGNADISVYIEGANKPSFDNLKQRLGISA